MKEYITTSDGKISVQRSCFIGHAVSENSIRDHIVLFTIAYPKGFCVNYSSREKMLRAAQEITTQISP